MKGRIELMIAQLLTLFMIILWNLLQNFYLFPVFLGAILLFLRKNYPSIRFCEL